MSAVFSDSALESWGERFDAAGLRTVMTFEEFMRMTPELRERRVQFALDAEASMARIIDRRHPDAAVHGGTLIESFHHGVHRMFRLPWFRNNRFHV